MIDKSGAGRARGYFEAEKNPSEKNRMDPRSAFQAVSTTRRRVVASEVGTTIDRISTT